MNDEFLTRFYETPRTEFAKALYQRIDRQPQPYVAGILTRKLTLRNSLLILALLFLIAACVYAVTDTGWHKVGSIWVNVERTYKVELDGPFTRTEQPGVQPARPECLMVEDAKKILRFEIRVPTWAPEGFTFVNKICGINQLSDFAFVYWEGTEKDAGIQIMASNLRMFNGAMQKYEVEQPFLWQPVPPGSYKEVRVHGQPAVLVRGDWDVAAPPSEVPAGQTVELNGKWDKKMALQLHWVDGETMYSLYARVNVSIKDLIKMAESAQ